MKITTQLTHEEFGQCARSVSQKHASSLLASVCLSVLGIGAPSVAFAQASEERTAPKEEVSSDEIIVTANKRSQTLRDVSISISAVNPDTLEKLGGDKFGEFLQGVAGVSTQDLGSQSQNVVFRGITSAPDGGSAVAVYFDELPNGGANGGIQIKPVDVARFEVLRGPQPILYGAGSLTGTLRLIPNRPNFSQAEYGADAGISHVGSSKGIGYDVSGYVSVPIVTDKAAIRVAGFVEREKGYVDNIRINRKDGGFKSEGGRASVALAPTETINILAQYVYQSNRFDGNSVYRPILSRADPSRGQFQIDRLATQSHSNVHLLGLTMDAELGAAKLTSVTSYNRTRLSSSADFSAFASFFELPFPEVVRLASARSKVFSQEVRLTNLDDADFDWAIGGFFQTGKSSSAGLTQTPDGTVPIAAIDGNSTNRDVSIFGQAGYQFTSNFDLSIGARYTWFSRRDTITTASLGVPDDPAEPIISKTTSFNPQVTLTYKPDGKHTYYARVAKGYRAPNATASSTPGCVVPKLKPDQVLNYEIGTKLSLSGGAVNINAAAYYIDWKGIPIFVTPPGCGPNDSFEVNAGEGKSYGLEAELVAKISKSFTLNTSVTLSRSALGKVPASFTGGVKGEQLPGNPNMRISGGLNYSTPISDKAKIFADVTAIYVGPYKNFLSGDFVDTFGGNFAGPNGEPPLIDGTDSAFLRDPGAGDYATVNLRTGVNFDNWSASIYANNVLNSRGTSVIYFPLDQLTPGEAPFSSVKPRTVGVDLSLRF